MVLYTPEHDATFWSLGAEGARRVVDLWAERTAALGARDDIAYVLVFENRGAEVGATITHPHGQIYAFDFVPELPLRELERGTAFGEPRERVVATAPGWRAWVPEAPIFPYALVLLPDDDVPDLPSLGDAGRDGLAVLLVDVLERLDRLFDAQTPYMLWIHQRPFDGGEWPQARVHVEIVSPWRGARPAQARRGRRARLGRVLQSGSAGGGCPGAPRRAAVAHAGVRDALDSLLFLGGRPSWERPELPSLGRLQPTATLVPFPTPELAATLDPEQSPWVASLEWRVGLPPRRAARRTRRGRSAAPAAGKRCRFPASGRCRASTRRTTRTS